MTADAARRLAESGLCWYDPRSPSYCLPDPDDVTYEVAAKGCGCDPCYHGKDRLARALLAALDREARAVALLERLTEMDVGFNDALDEARAFLAARDKETA